jgi:hypothetical protein
VITRPDGRPYRPRKPGLRAHAWENSDEAGVIVFGTLDPDAAQAFALESAAYWYGPGGAVVDPSPDWFRDCFRWGERRWERDEKRGAPGVQFTWVHAMPDLVPGAQPGDG